MRWLNSLLGFGASARDADGQHPGTVVDKGRKQRLDCPAHSGRRTGLFSRKLRPGSETGSSRMGGHRNAEMGPRLFLGKGQEVPPFVREESECPISWLAHAFKVHFPVTPRLNKPQENKSCCLRLNRKSLYRGQGGWRASQALPLGPKCCIHRIYLPGFLGLTPGTRDETSE